MRKVRLLSLLLCIWVLISVSSSSISALDATAYSTEQSDKSYTSKSNDTTENNVYTTVSHETSHNQHDEFAKESTDTLITVLTDDTSSEIVSAITSDEDFVIEGVLINGASKYVLNEYYDFSSMSKYHIADWAYANNLISEEEKIHCYCDLILNRNFDNIDCLTGIVVSIQQYQRENEGSLSDLDNKIDRILDSPLDSNSESSTRTISNEDTWSA